MTDKPLELKSPDNAMALGLYFVLTVVGGALLIAPAITAIMASFFGTAALVPVWALTMLLSAGGGLVSAFLADKIVHPVRALRVEASSVTVLGLTIVCYVLALLAAPKFSGITLIIWAGIACVCFWRALQVWRELRLIKIAQRRKLTTVMESLADPRPDK